MNEQPVTDALVRRFLLGQANDDERQLIESLFITDPVSNERILAAEQDLIEDYLEDCLDTEDKKSFLLQYGRTSSDQRKLRIMRSVKDWAVKEANAPPVRSSEISFWNRFFAGFKLKPVFVIPVAATSLVVITIFAFWLSRKPEDGIEEHLVMQQKLVQLNDSTSLREALPQMKVQELTPVSVRGVEQRELTTQDNAQVIELRLAWIQQDSFSRYRASIRRVGDDKAFTLDSVPAEGDGGKTIQIRLPPHFLKRGAYQIELRSIDAKGSVGLAEEYSFSVSG